MRRPTKRWHNTFSFHRLTCYYYNTMDSKHTYTVEEGLKIIDTLSPKDRETIISMLLLGEAEFERLVKDDFAKYAATFKALA